MSTSPHLSFFTYLQAIGDIDVSAITLYPYADGTVTVYTAARTYSGIETDSSSWTQVYSGASSKYSISYKNTDVMPAN